MSRESYRERILNAKEAVYAGDEDTTVWIRLAQYDAGYSVQFTPTEVVVHSECCASTPSLAEAREIHAALGAWLEIQDERKQANR